ncbi:hypothetical protein A9Z42_0091140 [Trichoderma parareesei]|uniref:Uncharacterized protein n=1 Tax=Trichoderma parareesei TaxID=858221 RepID=A0A2H2ZMY1_TRIPA|nr:hypothetical protein A9Z42_0091140 [Trichoderma parareesei]
MDIPSSESLPGLWGGRGGDAAGPTDPAGQGILFGAKGPSPDEAKPALVLMCREDEPSLETLGLGLLEEAWNLM